ALGATFLLASTVATGFAEAQAEEQSAEPSPPTTGEAPPTPGPPPSTTSTTAATEDPPPAAPAAEPEDEPVPHVRPDAPGSGAPSGVSGTGGGFSGDGVEPTATVLTLPVSSWWASDFDVRVQVQQSSRPTAPAGTVGIYRRMAGDAVFVW